MILILKKTSLDVVTNECNNNLFGWFGSIDSLSHSQVSINCFTLDRTQAQTMKSMQEKFKVKERLKCAKYYCWFVCRLTYLIWKKETIKWWMANSTILRSMLNGLLTVHKRKENKLNVFKENYSNLFFFSILL